MKVLFQGDSITDAGRDRSDYHNLGEGYPFYAAQYIKEDNPDIDFEDIYCAPDFATGALLLNESAVKDSLKNGNFYATNGPEIKSLYIEDGVFGQWYISNNNGRDN